MGETFAGLVTDGPLLVAAAVAALVGLISFASPCVLPLVPGYLSYVAGPGRHRRAGRPPSAGGPGARRPRCAPTPAPRGAAWCSARCCSCSGSAAVFVTFATAFGGLGRLLLEYSVVLDRVFGVVTVLVGLAFLGWLPLLQRTKKLSVRPAAGLAGRAAARRRLRPRAGRRASARPSPRCTRWP